MARFIKGEIVTIPFPYSNLADAKNRPALIIALLDQGDFIACQITSQNYSQDSNAISLRASDFLTGGLPHDGYIRVGKLFTANEGLVIRSNGLVNQAKLDEVVKQIITIVSK